tara:strand:+ start:1215 stop:2321 length:1107 start_codon:yes stop_codon:yes gene_type:complete
MEEAEVAERKQNQQSGVFNQFSNWLNPAPTQINRQTGPYEMGASQVDAFGRRYPTPRMTPTTPGIAPQYQRPNQHRGHTDLQHSAARYPGGQIQGPPAPQQSGMLSYIDNPHVNAKIAAQSGDFEVPSLLDDESREYMRNMDQKRNQDPGGEFEHMAAMGDLDMYGDKPPGLNLRRGDQSLEEPQYQFADRDYTINEPAPSGKMGIEDAGNLAAMGGINAADALGKGVRGALGYGKNLLNAALYGKGSDRDIVKEGGQALQQGGQALGKTANFVQRGLFGTPDAPPDPNQQSGMTPEKEAMWQQGMEDNPWLAQEGDSQAATDRWWDQQEYGQKVGGPQGFYPLLGGLKAAGSTLGKMGEWWWGLKGK